ncbi:hypothetical protein [Rhabdaerophilum sp.]|uniref:hypothetical protein n=1 Tax=Rhabdaerophilum sp. TaxID=2717341 RepID=UPI0038D4E07B
MNPEPTIDDLKLNKDISLELFKVHADQRMKLMNFYIVIVGFSIGGYFTALQNVGWQAALIVSLFLLFMTFCFWSLDRRTKQIVKISETSLKVVTQFLQEKIGKSEVEIVGISDNRQGNWSYSQVFTLIFAGCATLAVAGIVHSLLKACK